LNLLAETIQWPSRWAPLQLAGQEIHVWASPLNIGSGALDTFATTLLPDEKERAERFKFDVHRNRFIAGRGALREILGQYLQVNPADLRFSYSPNGKPVLAEQFANSGIHFNLAHSEDMALFAVTRIGPVGVDVECVRPIKNVEELVARFFSSRENELFQNVPADEKPASFFNLWTRKEALLKATGEGITRSLSLVEVSFLQGESARLLAVSGDAAKAAQWSLRELTPAAGFAGAVAVEAREVSVRCGKWESAGTP
jgi:4'-phosphopantetheinyl transferase